MSEVLLAANDLYMSYHTGRRHVDVLSGVSLESRAGEILAITGASGSGKSTLLNLLGSLDRPQRGSILWDGKEILGLTGGELNRLRSELVGFVFQSHHLLADFTAVENIVIPARVAGVDLEDAQERAEALLDRVGLSGRADHRPGELSGGEQQRVAVARALMNRPKILLADEPAGNLDRGRAEELHQLLEQARDEEGLTIVVVTHDEAVATRADRWLHLEDGGLFDNGAARGE